jgi:general nucleoside transport system permease protein
LIRKLIGYLVAALLTLLAMGVFLAALSADPWRGLYTILTTSFQSSFAFWQTVEKFIPLLMATYAFAITYKIRLFNIGGLGQMQVGAIAATIVALELKMLPAFLLIGLALAAAALAAGAYGMIAGWIWNTYRVNPIISTVMLRFISGYLVLFTVSLPRYADPTGGHPMTEPFPAAAILPYWGQVPSWLVIALITVVAVYVLLRKTVFGYRIDAAGMNPNAASVYGIPAPAIVLASFFAAGCMAGLGGAVQVMGVQHRLIDGFALTSGAEFSTFGILTSLLAGGNPIALPIAALFMSVLLVGADAMQRTMGVPVETVFLMQAALVLLVVTLRSEFERRWQ